MPSSGTAAAIRSEPGNLRYEYYSSFDDPETVLLIDSWTDQNAIDVHHASPISMCKIFVGKAEKSIAFLPKLCYSI